MAEITDRPLTVAGFQQSADPAPTSMQSAASLESSVVLFCCHQAASTHRTPASLHLYNRRHSH